LTFVLFVKTNYMNVCNALIVPTTPRINPTIPVAAGNKIEDRVEDDSKAITLLLLLVVVDLAVADLDEEEEDDDDDDDFDDDANIVLIIMRLGKR
jgi:hypothetical protein